MVCNSAGASGGLPCNSTNPARSSSDPSRAGIYDETESAPTDHFQQSYLSQGFSSEASSLMLASSRRGKINSNYSSSFAEWDHWWHQQGKNPLSGPITDVISFLVDFSAQGYQYQSFNSYRSAISLVHEAVNGVSVGVHPAVERLLKGAKTNHA